MVRGTRSTPRKRTHNSEGATVNNEATPVKKICSDFNETTIKPVDGGFTSQPLDSQEKSWSDDKTVEDDLLQGTPNMDTELPDIATGKAKTVKRQLQPHVKEKGRLLKTPKTAKISKNNASTSGKRRGRPPKSKPTDTSDLEPKDNSVCKPSSRKRKVSLSLLFDDSDENYDITEDGATTRDDSAKKPITNVTSPQEQSTEATTSCETTIKTATTSTRSSFDNNIDIDDCDKDEMTPPYDEVSLTSDSDSDSDLVPFSPTKSDTSRPTKGDLLWVKVRNVPFWPAVVKQLYNKGKKISFVFIGYEKPERYRITYNKQKVLPYFDVKEEQLKEFKEAAKNSQWGADFENSLNLVEDYVRKKGLGEETRSTLEYFYTDLEDSDLSSDEEKVVTPEREITKSRVSDSESEEEVGEPVGTTPTLSQKALLSQSIRTKSGQKLVDFIKSDLRVKDRLMNIKDGKTESKLHQEYMTPVVKKGVKVLPGIGPLQDHQVEEVVMYLMELYPNTSDTPLAQSVSCDVMSYIQSVWYPEVVVFALTKVRGLSYSKAWERFYQGDKQTKEELEFESQVLLESAKNIEPEVQARYQLRLDDMEKKTFGKLI